MNATDQDPWWRRGWISLCEKHERRGYTSLTTTEKVWINVRSLVDAVENGGAISFFYNPWAGALVDTLAALDLLGAGDVRLELDRVSALFDGGVSEALEERNAVIASWPDGLHDALLAEVDGKMFSRFATLEASLDGFIRREGLAG